MYNYIKYSVYMFFVRKHIPWIYTEMYIVQSCLVQHKPHAFLFPEIYLKYSRTFTPLFSLAWTCWPEIYLGYTRTFTPLFSLAWTCWPEIYLGYTRTFTPLFSLAWICWPEIYLGYKRTFTPLFSSAWTCWPEIYLGYMRTYSLLFRWVCSYTCCGLPGNKTGRPFSYFRPEGTLINKTIFIQGYPQLVRLQERLTVYNW